MSNRHIVTRSTTWILGALFALALTACGQQATETFTVFVSLHGDGAGTVTSEPEGIDTSATGASSADFDSGTEVTLTAAATAGSELAGWGGDCSSATGDTCTVSVEEATDVTATFTQVQHTLGVTTSGSGGGAVTSTPAGITCGNAFTDCGEEFDSGETVTLQADANAGSAFVGWSGECTGLGTCEVTMDGDANVDAEFVLETELTEVLYVVGSTPDDAEEFLSATSNSAFQAGGVTTVDSDLDLGFDQNSGDWDPVGTVVGLRFFNVQVPSGAVITSSSITFTATAAGEGDVTFTFEGEASDDAASFTSSTDGNSDITSRVTTTASSEWALTATDLWTPGEQEVSSDLAGVVQEIVDRVGWTQGNAMAFIVSSDDASASNYRVAESINYPDSAPGDRPLLSITYHVP